MYARIIKFQLQPGKIDELVAIGTHSVAPMMQQQPGCKLITLLTDPAANTAMVVGFWESEADLLATEQNGVYQEQMAKTKHLLAAPPTRDLYAVSLQTAPI